MNGCATLGAEANELKYLTKYKFRKNLSARPSLKMITINSFPCITGRVGFFFKTENHFFEKLLQNKEKTRPKIKTLGQ